ncbi:uncharacterized protein F4822DRAFT_5421 [Hypoxylon trugodes]|uniref:uncharacterized protein n=1 Tax=Hypoxylon trugodes TaxID=326681 RepID=UPI002199EDB2|nr:uncharacterized protein F4822DRAFT_5421 [Hypoxylon trugodes]KAI1393252.1 hypothetical protein F4822DRAFT_5421 [Hypoxylon trugodes]
MAHKKRQTRLTFEPVNPTSSPKQPSPNQVSPAKIRYSKKADASSSPSHASPKRPPTASFMPRLYSSRPVAAGDDSSDDPLTEVEDEIPTKSSQSISTKLRRTVIDLDDDEDEDDDENEEPIAPPSTLKRRRPIVVSDDDDDDNDDDDDGPIVAPSSSRRSRPRLVELDGLSDRESSPAKRRKTSLATPGRLRRPTTVTSSSPTKRSVPKGHRSERQKKMELLRRRRAGEKIDNLTSSEEDSEIEKRGIYDTDSDEEFAALKEFDDDEPEDEAESEVPIRQASPKSKKLSRKHEESDHREDEDEGDENGLDDFVVDDDDDAPIGAPANLDIPLEFTAQAHRPLKDQFPYVIEWLVHNRLNPAFERNDPVYSNAWRKLDDEVRALASSKFASSVWRSEFYRALKGRPKMEAYEMDRGERSSGLYDTCDACGRSNHPATFRIYFAGHPYYKNTLAEVESDLDSEDDDGDESGHESVDTQGMVLPTTKKEWNVGVVCCSNAETAHSLIHWKHALKQWVEERLEEDGWMNAKKLKERERMKARKRRDLANHIVDEWREKNIIASLYRDFKNTLEDARNKATTGRNRGRFR